MAEVSKTEVEIVVKCSAQKFYECLKYSLHHLPTIYPDAFSHAQILEGDGESEGSLRLWKYNLPGTGEVETVKARTTKQDDENMLIALCVEEGHVHNLYRHITLFVQVTPKGEGASVRWTVEFEKHHDEIPDPHIYMEIYKKMNENIEAHVLETQK